MNLSRSSPPAAESTAPWPALVGEEPVSCRWLRPGELLAIPMPTTALQLDALLRHLEIDAEFGDWPGATIHLAQARSTWQRLEPAVTARASLQAHLRGARKAVREMTRALDRAADGVRRAAQGEVMQQARAAIAQIETIERVLE